MTATRIVNSRQYKSVIEIDTNAKGDRVHIDVRNIMDGLIEEEAAIIVGLHEIVHALNEALEGTGRQIALWKEI